MADFHGTKPAVKGLKSSAAASTRHPRHRPLFFEPCSLPFASMALLFLGRSSLPFASRQRLKILRGSFDHALWPQAFVLGALQPAVCLHGPLFLGRCRLPAVKGLRSSAAASTRHSGHRPLFLEPCSLPWQLRPGTLATGLCS